MKKVINRYKGGGKYDDCFCNSKEIRHIKPAS